MIQIRRGQVLSGSRLDPTAGLDGGEANRKETAETFEDLEQENVEAEATPSELDEQDEEETEADFSVDEDEIEVIADEIADEATPEASSHRSQIREESFKTSPEKMFGMLIKPSSIRKWWDASAATVVPEVGGIWSVTWGDEDDPDHIVTATILEIERPERLVLKYGKYRSKAGELPFEFSGDAVTTFSIKPNGKDCSLRVEQTGFPSDESADDFYALCETGWKDTFEGIRNIWPL